MYYYKVFGFILSSPVKFQWPIEQISAPEKVNCEIVQCLCPISKQGWNLFYTSTDINQKTSQPGIRMFSAERGLLVVYPDFGDFEIQPSKITYYWQKQSERSILEPRLFQNILVLWLELIGMPVLHASGIVIKDSAIGFLANGGDGKSTLAAAFVQTHAEILTDDIFPVETHLSGYRARPGYTWLRLLPEAATALGYQSDTQLEKFAIRIGEVHGHFCSEPVSLNTLYLLERNDSTEDVLIDRVSSKYAYLSLLRHSFAGKWLVKSPLNTWRMVFFVNLVKEIPIKRLIYPSGYKHLSAVVEAVNKDLSL